MNKNNYPTNRELNIIRNWDFDKKSILLFLGYIKEMWNYTDFGSYILTGRKVLKLQLHTGGWSGNEDTLKAMQDNVIFWVMCWEKSLRGGHYYFRIDLKAFKK